MIDLFPEFCSTDDPTDDANGRAALARIGVYAALCSWQGPRMIGASNVQIIDSKRFALDRGGRRMLIVPVWNRPLPLNDGLDGYEPDPLLDLIAFRPERPSQWWTLRGEAMLGEVWADCAAHFDEPLHVYSSPLSWLTHGGRGCCVLDWENPPWITLANCRRLIAENAETARRLARVTNPRIFAPEIRIPAIEEVAA